MPQATPKPLCPHDQTELKPATSDSGILGFQIPIIHKDLMGNPNLIVGSGFSVNLLLCERCGYLEMRDLVVDPPKEISPQKIVYPPVDTE